MTGLLAPPEAAPPSDGAGGRSPEGSAPRGRGRAAGPADADPAPPNMGPAPSRRARVRRAATAAGVVLALGAIGSAGWWGPRALSRLAFFRVRRVEIEGARYASPRALAARLAIDTSASVWGDLDVLRRRVAADPLVAGVRVERRLPGVLRVVVQERVPVAAVAGAHGALVIYDALGIALPLAPSHVGGVDVPLAASADPALLRALGALRADAPRLYARVLEAARAPRAALAAAAMVGLAPGAARVGGTTTPVPAGAEHDELDFVVAPAVTPSGNAERAAPAVAPVRAVAAAPVLVRTAVDVSAARFADLGPVEADLTRRGVRPTELDLRFRDQVVARLP